MSIGVGQTSIGATSGGTTATTAAKNTASSGSTFVVLCNFFPGVAAATPITDNKGNTYVPMTGITPQSAFELLYICENAAGGSGHTHTLTLSVSGNPVLIMIEITGGVTSGILDKHNQAGSDGVITSPYLSGSSGTLSQANELAMIYAESDSGNNPATFAVNSIGATPNTGWTMHEKQENGVTDNCIMVASQVVASTAACEAAFTSTGSDGFSASYILTFKEAGGGGATPKNLMLLGCGS